MLVYPIKTSPQPVLLPLYGGTVVAGFPSPADDYIQGHLSLDELLIEHHAATFFVRMDSDQMAGAGVLKGDLLVVDRAQLPQSGSLVIAVVEGALVLRRYLKRGRAVILQTEEFGADVRSMITTETVEVWGTVTAIVRKLV